MIDDLPASVHIPYILVVLTLHLRKRPDLTLDFSGMGNKGHGLFPSKQALRVFEPLLNDPGAVRHLSSVVLATKLCYQLWHACVASISLPRSLAGSVQSARCMILPWRFWSFPQLIV